MYPIIYWGKSDRLLASGNGNKATAGKALVEAGNTVADAHNNKVRPLLIPDGAGGTTTFNDFVKQGMTPAEYSLHQDKRLKLLRKLGPVGTAIGLLAVSAEASAAVEAGDTALAEEIVGNYVLESAGGFMAGFVAGGAASLALNAFPGVGTLANFLIATTAGVIGSFAGEAAVKEFLESRKDAGPADQAIVRRDSYVDHDTETRTYPNGTESFTHYVDGVARFEGWKYQTPDGGTRELLTALHPEPGGQVSESITYDSNGIKTSHDATFSLGDKAGVNVIHVVGPQAGGSRILTKVGVDAIDASFDANGEITAVNAINGKPPANGDMALQEMRELGVTEATLSGDISGELGDAVAGVVHDFDASADPSGAQTLADALSGAGQAFLSASPSLIDALSLMNAIKSGQPLPIAVSGLRLANLSFCDYTGPANDELILELAA